MSIYLEHANITVKSIDEATRLLGAAFPDFAVRGGGEFRGVAGFILVMTQPIWL